MCDRRTDWQTENTICRAAWSQLKRWSTYTWQLSPDIHFVSFFKGSGESCFHQTFGVLAFSKFQEHLSHPWACSLWPHLQLTITLQTYRPRRFQWTWFEVNQPSGCWVHCLQDSRSHYHAHGHAHYALMGKWPWRCTPTAGFLSSEQTKIRPF